MKVVGINGSPRLVNFSVRIFDIQETRHNEKFQGEAKYGQIKLK
jgi:hypothetical protein